MNPYQETNIDLMFSDGIKQEAIFFLLGVYVGIRDYNGLADLSDTKSGVFLISELERADYLKRGKDKNRSLELTEKGIKYLISKKFILEEKEEEIKLGKLERQLVTSAA